MVLLLYLMRFVCPIDKSGCDVRIKSHNKWNLKYDLYILIIGFYLNIIFSHLIFSNKTDLNLYLHPGIRKILFFWQRANFFGTDFLVKCRIKHAIYRKLLIFLNMYKTRTCNETHNLMCVRFKKGDDDDEDLLNMCHKKENISH